MPQAVWWTLVLVAVVGAGIVIVVLGLRRRRVVPDDPQTRKKLAERAIREMAKDSHRKGSIRGTGYGGDDKLSRDAGYGSGDTGSGI